jgi:hypothetical protein
VLNSVHLWAKVAQRSWVALLRKVRDVVVEAVAAVDAARGVALRAAYGEPAGDAAGGEEALRGEERADRRLRSHDNPGSRCSRRGRGLP